MLAHVLGYVSEIGPAQLELPKYKENGYRAGDTIGREGLEAVYDGYLRGRDGSRTIIVDSLARTQAEIERVRTARGQVLVTTIDLDLQLVAEAQLANSPSQRGVIVVMNPNNGELLALASYRPSTRTSSRSASQPERGAPSTLRSCATRKRRFSTAPFAGATRPARRGRYRWRWPG